MAEVESKLQALTDDYQKLQQDLSESVLSRQKLEGQKQENVSEFEKLAEGETIFKLVGPVLLKQDKIEAESTVKGRLDYITSEISRVEDQIKSTQDKSEKKKMEIIKLQTEAQTASPGQGK